MERLYRIALVVLLCLGCHELSRIASALNESNHIMVGVENGDVPGMPAQPGRFDHAPAPKEF